MEYAVSSRERIDTKCLLLTAYCFLVYQSGSQTPCTDLHFLSLAFYIDPHRLEVWIPAPFRFIVSVTYIMAYSRSLTAYFTYLRHPFISLCIYSYLFDLIPSNRSSPF